jgi:uncharacterized membrane protein
MKDSVKDFLSKEAKVNIAHAIQFAEKKTTGEIRIRIDAHFKGNILAAATKVFYKLNMDKTQNKNGVLLYIAVEEHQFCIIGDTEINQIVQQAFWDNICNEMRDFFVVNKFEQGIIYAIQKIGDILHQHFPLNNKNNDNELPNEISFGDDNK